MRIAFTRPNNAHYPRVEWDSATGQKWVLMPNGSWMEYMRVGATNVQAMILRGQWVLVDPAVRLTEGL